MGSPAHPAFVPLRSTSYVWITHAHIWAIRLPPGHLCVRVSGNSLHRDVAGDSRNHLS
jgi:hypothetical protein